MSVTQLCSVCSALCHAAMLSDVGATPLTTKRLYERPESASHGQLHPTHRCSLHRITALWSCGRQPNLPPLYSASADLWQVPQQSRTCRQGELGATPRLEQSWSFLLRAQWNVGVFPWLLCQKINKRNKHHPPQKATTGFFYCMSSSSFFVLNILSPDTFDALIVIKPINDQLLCSQHWERKRNVYATRMSLNTFRI